MALTDTAAALVARWAPAAPAGVQADAAGLLVKVLTVDPATRDAAYGGQRITRPVGLHRGAMRESGAAGLLEPWRVRRALPIEAAE